MSWKDTLLIRPAPVVERGVAGPDRRRAAAALFFEMAAAGNKLRMRVTGHSMRPFLRSGDVVEVHPAAAGDLVRGAIALVFDADGLAVLHRVVVRWHDHRGRAWVQTGGDALLAPDAPVPVDRVLGKVVRIQRGRRRGRNGATVPLDLTTGRWRLLSRLVAVLWRFRWQLVKWRHEKTGVEGI